MDNNKEHSSIQLSSNIMLKSRFDKDRWSFLPPDLLPAYYSDSRNRGFLTVNQRKQLDRKMLYANRIIDE